MLVKERRKILENRKGEKALSPTIASRKESRDRSPIDLVEYVSRSALKN